MSNKGWKKLMHRCHANTFECPVCSSLFKFVEDDIKLGTPNPNLSMSHSNVSYHITCKSCGAFCGLNEGVKQESYYEL